MLLHKEHIVHGKLTNFTTY